jgi:uncharacterized protein (TIGR00255 family)
MIVSMTGFAREAGTIEDLSFAWEIRSVNGRGLDVRVRNPAGLDALGEEARKAVLAAAARGTVNVNLAVARSEAHRGQARLNEAALADVAAQARAAAERLGLAPPSFDALIAVRGVIEVDEAETGPSQAAQAAILKALPIAVEAWRAARRAEGVALAEVLAAQFARIGALVAAVEGHPRRTSEAIRERLAQQVAALTDGASALDPARLHQEAVLLATRADVREELDRLVAHVAAGRTLLAEGGAIGRKLDFLAQEFGREASTLCAKAGHVELSQIGLELRTLVDQMREQCQNVE